MFSFIGHIIFVLVLSANFFSLFKLESRHFHVEDVTAMEESSRYLFSQCWVSIFSGILNFLLEDKVSARQLNAVGLYLFNFVEGLPGSGSSRVVGLDFLGGWGPSSSSEEGGAETWMLPKGNSTSQVRGEAAKTWPPSKLSSSRLGIRRRRAAMSFMMFVLAECLVERAILVVSGLELKRIGIGPAVVGWWSMSTLRV